jgi:hypothetical protein
MHKADTDRLTELPFFFFLPIPGGHNMNSQKPATMVYVPNHTCATLSVPDLYCLMPYVLYKMPGTTQFH